jgi:hypothetical protein
MEGLLPPAKLDEAQIQALVEGPNLIVCQLLDAAQPGPISFHNFL